jgi:glycosyltransferase involved in cell wall biosynthesis
VIRHVVVPYPRSNSTVRARALHWADRAVASGALAPGDVSIHGPGFPFSALQSGVPLLLVRNASRLTRGQRETRLMQRAAPGVYDLDDGLPWDDGNLPGLGRWWKRPFPRSLTARRAAAAADRVIAGNEVIADWASAWCDDVVTIPTCVEPSEYERRVTWAIEPGRPRVGWIGSPATEHYLFDLIEPLVEAHRLHGLRLEIVSGDGVVPPALASFTTRRRWNEHANKWIATWDIGLMPLRDGVYERAKCGYKLLQYAASGVPAIGSPVGVNRTILRDMDGLAPTTAAEWVDALGQLIDEQASRREQRASRGLLVAQRFSYARWQTDWFEAVGW